MALAAAQVIDAVAERLVPLPATAGRVHTSRAWPISQDGLPAWRVTAEDEAVDDVMLDGTNQHQLTVAVRGLVRAVADLDDELHALAAAALAALFAPPAPYELQLTGIRRQMATEGESSVGVVTLLLRATYHVNPSAPEVII